MHVNKAVEILKRRTDSKNKIKNGIKVSLDFDNVRGKYHQESAKNGISESLNFEIFWVSMPQDPLRACDFGASQLPRVSEKSGYGPVKFRGSMCSCGLSEMNLVTTQACEL